MRRLAKNLILATAVVSAIFFVDLSHAGAASLHCEKAFSAEIICSLETDAWLYMDFWSKFRDTVMPDPDEPQNNNPPKEMEKPKPAQPPREVAPPREAAPPREVHPQPAD